MIVVLDTNVVVSALVFGSPSSTPVLALARATDKDRLATCAELRLEVFRILSTKFAWTSAETETTLNHIFNDALRVTLHHTVHLCRDPADDMPLEYAERAQADLLITGDKDLLALNSHGPTAIVTPAAYLLL